MRSFRKKKDLTKPRKSQTITWELAILFHQFSWRIYRRYIVKRTGVVFFLKIGINLYSKSTRFLYCYFWLRGKPVENISLSLVIISPRSLHNFWTFPRYANHRYTGHATMAPSTRIRIFSNPQLFRCGYGYRPHVYGEFDSESVKK